MNINTVTKEAQTEIAALLPEMSKEDIRTFAEYFVTAWYQPKHQNTNQLPESVYDSLFFWGVI